MKPYPKNKFSSCPDCGATGTITVVTLVWSTGRYTDSSREYAGGGMVEGALCAVCDACKTTFWRQDDVFKFTTTESGWNAGPCPSCHNELIDELNIDSIKRHFDGSYCRDVERITTLHYECQNCGEILKCDRIKNISDIIPCT